jgi:DNA-binding CsgD family transcriptional regulator
MYDAGDARVLRSASNGYAGSIEGKWMGRQRLFLLGAGAAVLVAVLATLDIVMEGEGFDAADFALELLDRGLSVGAMVLVAWMTFAVRDVRAEQAVLRRDLARAVAEGAGWRAANGGTLDSLATAIGRQFDAWSLTGAERDIAGLMLKGVSLRDIAGLRHTSESTIRQQAQSIYQKSGLAGRRELAAFFLESLFEARDGPDPRG